MCDEAYNGFFNYATWLVATEWDNVESLYDEVREVVLACGDTTRGRAKAVIAVGRLILDHHYDNRPDYNHPFHRKVVTEFLLDVQWHEVAEHIVDGIWQGDD